MHRSPIRGRPWLTITSVSDSPSVATRNAWDLSLANFTVIAGDNRLSRPVAGGSAESGSLRGEEVEHSNLTLNTESGLWQYVSFDQMFISTT